MRYFLPRPSTRIAVPDIAFTRAPPLRRSDAVYPSDLVLRSGRRPRLEGRPRPAAYGAILRDAVLRTAPQDEGMEYVHTRSDDVGEAAFHFPEVPDADGDRRRGHGERDPHRAGVERNAEQRPAEAVDDPDQRVERIEQAPRFRHVGGGESHRRDEQAELHDERNDVAEVAVFDVERSEQQSEAEREGEGPRQEGR